MYKYITAIFIFGVFACKLQSNNTDAKILDFGLFSIEVPKSWEQIKEQGTDSYVGRIAIDNNDTLDFDLGLFSNNLYEYDPNILDSNMMKYVDTSININEIIFVENRHKVDPDKYRKNNISWDTIDGRKAKIVYPRLSGIGTTGIYIDSLWISHADVAKFNLFGKNLKPENEKMVLHVLKTIKFHKD